MLFFPFSLECRKWREKHFHWRKISAMKMYKWSIRINTERPFSYEKWGRKLQSKIGFLQVKAIKFVYNVEKIFALLSRAKAIHRNVKHIFFPQLSNYKLESSTGVSFKVNIHATFHTWSHKAQNLVCSATYFRPFNLHVEFWKSKCW